MANEIILDGWDKFKGKLNNLPLSITEKADSIVYDEALRWKELADKSARSGMNQRTGTLRRNLSVARISQLSYEIVSPIKYSPYREWGTGTKVSVPAGLTNYALQFKGAKKTLGSRPTPFFFIHKKTIEASLYARIEKLLQTPQ